MKVLRDPWVWLFTLIYAVTANAWIPVRQMPLILVVLIPAALAVNWFAGRYYFDRIPNKKLKLEYHGVACLTIFLVVCGISAIVHAVLVWRLGTGEWKMLLISVVWCVVTLWILFWNGMISVYITSVQLGIRTRVIGAAFGWIFPINLYILLDILRKCHNEVIFETQKHDLNAARKEQKICATKYPILLVHGVFFRDFKLLNYWGRIPDELKQNGATVYYGEHQSARAVADSAAELRKRIEKIVADTGCKKVNIIAHSKGGLDCREAMANGALPYVASLTTVNTPHRGCEFADYLLGTVPEKVQKKVEKAYNIAAAKLGDDDPDFMEAVKDLTASRCVERDQRLPAPPTVFCQSIGSRLDKAASGKFPMNVSFPLVRHFDGPNDGMVGEKSFRWGEKYIFLEPKHRRGISHADMIDMNRENIPGFDVREFYVQLVSDLRERGL